MRHTNYKQCNAVKNYAHALGITVDQAWTRWFEYDLAEQWRAGQ